MLRIETGKLYGRDRYRTSQHKDFATDERKRLKASLLQILKILVFRRLSQLDANAERLQFFVHFRCLEPLR